VTGYVHYSRVVANLIRMKATRDGEKKRFYEKIGRIPSISFAYVGKSYKSICNASERTYCNSEPD
jgi:hypothetical protein